MMHVAPSGIPSLGDALAGMQLAELSLTLDARQDHLDEMVGATGRGPLWRYAYSLTRNADKAEDLAQDAALAAHASLDSFRGEPQMLKAWLFKIVRNKRIDDLRHRKDDPEFTEFDDEKWRAEEHGDDGSLSTDLDAGLDALEPRQRELIEQVVIGDKSCAAYAAQTGETAASVRQRKLRACKQLAAALATATGSQRIAAPPRGTASFLLWHQPATRKARAQTSDTNIN